MSTVDPDKQNGTNSDVEDKPAKRAKGNGERKPGVDQLDRRDLLAALRSFKRGDFNIKMREDMTGVDGQIAETFNEIVETVRSIKDEAADVSLAVGKYGQAQRRVRRFNATGGWQQYISSMNAVIEDLTGHSNEIARVVSA